MQVVVMADRWRTGQKPENVDFVKIGKKVLKELKEDWKEKKVLKVLKED